MTTKPLEGKTIVLGITGGIAAYKSADLSRRLIESGATVHVAMTPAACDFVTPTTFQALSGNPVHTETINVQLGNSMAHINLSRQADAIIIAPASADFLAKLAAGFADSLLSTLCLARPAACPLAVVPAMNREMWANPATQRNLKHLKEDGIQIFGPAFGSQACGETGPGRMLEPPEILEESIKLLSPKPMNGLRVLITAGPTHEYIDPVRVLSNLSSGKTGYAIAQAARRAGAAVTLISGTHGLPDPYGVCTVHVNSALDMRDAVMTHARDNDIFISVAAVADWRIANPSAHKIKKSARNPFEQLQFERNPDILAEVAALPDGPWCVGFAAETENLTEHAQNKRRQKHIDVVVGNLAQDVMGQDHTRLMLLSDRGEQNLPEGSKTAAAQQLVEALMDYYPDRART